MLKLGNSTLEVLVDDCLLEELNSIGPWYLNSSGYVFCNNYKGRVRKNLPRCIMLSRYIINYFGLIKVVDHINRNRLDNRKENLRLLSWSDNIATRKYRKLNSTGYRFVKTCGGKARRTGFIAQVSIKNNIYYSKAYKTAFQAAVDAQNYFTIHRPNLNLDVIFEHGKGLS